jgi:hypothetical protein
MMEDYVKRLKLDIGETAKGYVEAIEAKDDEQKDKYAIQLYHATQEIEKPTVHHHIETFELLYNKPPLEELAAFENVMYYKATRLRGILQEDTETSLYIMLGNINSGDQLLYQALAYVHGFHATYENKGFRLIFNNEPGTLGAAYFNNDPALFIDEAIKRAVKSAVQVFRASDQRYVFRVQEPYFDRVKAELLPYGIDLERDSRDNMVLLGMTFVGTKRTADLSLLGDYLKCRLNPV